MYNRATSSAICRQCAHLIVPDGAKDRWYFWLCGARPREALYNPVTGQGDTHPPYYLAKDVNGGDCKFYQPGPNILRPRATQDGEINDGHQ